MAEDLKGQNAIAWTAALIRALKTASTSTSTRDQESDPSPAWVAMHMKSSWTTSTIHRLGLSDPNPTSMDLSPQ